MRRDRRLSGRNGHSSVPVTPMCNQFHRAMQEPIGVINNQHPVTDHIRCSGIDRWLTPLPSSHPEFYLSAIHVKTAKRLNQAIVFKFRRLQPTEVVNPRSLTQQIARVTRNQYDIDVGVWPLRAARVRADNANSRDTLACPCPRVEQSSEALEVHGVKLAPSIASLNVAHLSCSSNASSGLFPAIAVAVTKGRGGACPAPRVAQSRSSTFTIVGSSGAGFSAKLRSLTRLNMA